MVAWIKEIFDGRTEFTFFQEKTEGASLEMKLDWVPDGLVCVMDELHASGHSLVYVNPDAPQEGFALNSGYIQEGTRVIMNHTGGAHEIRAVDIHGMTGELYLSEDSSTTHALIWMDEAQGIYFTLTSYETPDVILHIAESVHLVDSPK